MLWDKMLKAPKAASHFQLIPRMCPTDFAPPATFIFVSRHWEANGGGGGFWKIKPIIIDSMLGGVVLLEGGVRTMRQVAPCML